MNKLFLSMVTAFCFLLLGSCNDDDEQYPKSMSISNKQADMTVVVPIHPSSLEYFDYIVRYSDNNGVVQVDTIRKENGAFVVEDCQDRFSSAERRTEIDNYNCYVKNYNYTSLPVSNNVILTVELIPKYSKDSVVSFSFITPKPYIFLALYDSATPNQNDTLNQMLEDIESIRIDSMSVSLFLSTYGHIFSSQYGIYASEDGCEITYN